MTTRQTKASPPLPETGERNSPPPFGGLFGDTVIAHVVEEMIANPGHAFTPKGLRELTHASLPRIREALKTLSAAGLVENISASRKRPRFAVRAGQKRLAALKFLALAVIDDSDGSKRMDLAIRDYCGTEPGRGLPVLAVADAPDYRVIESMTTMTMHPSMVTGCAPEG
jgi:hypothetical protein